MKLGLNLAVTLLVGSTMERKQNGNRSAIWWQHNSEGASQSGLWKEAKCVYFSLQKRAYHGQRTRWTNNPSQVAGWFFHRLRHRGVEGFLKSFRRTVGARSRTGTHSGRSKTDRIATTFKLLQTTCKGLFFLANDFQVWNVQRSVNRGDHWKLGQSQQPKPPPSLSNKNMSVFTPLLAKRHVLTWVQTWVLNLGFNLGSNLDSAGFRTWVPNLGSNNLG